MTNASTEEREREKKNTLSPNIKETCYLFPNNKSVPDWRGALSAPLPLTPAASPLLCVIWALRACPDGQAAIRSRRNPLTDPYSHWVTLALPK